MVGEKKNTANDQDEGLVYKKQIKLPIYETFLTRPDYESENQLYCFTIFGIIFSIYFFFFLQLQISNSYNELREVLECTKTRHVVD